MPTRKFLPLAAALLALAASNPLRAQTSHVTVLYSAAATAAGISGDDDVYTTGFTLQGLLDHATDQPHALSSLRSRELNPVAIGDGDGGYIAAYTVEHTDSAHFGDRDIVMQHVNRTGESVWGDSVTHVLAVAKSNYIEQNPRLARLADGSVLVCYEIHYGPARSNDIDIAAIRYTREGLPAWPHAQWVASSSKRQELLKGLEAQADGGAIALIESHTSNDTAMTGSDVLAQRIDSSSRTGWKDSDQPAVVAASPYLETNPVMTSDGAGGAYVAYQLEYNKGPRAGDVDVFAQHITSVGSRTWTDENNLPVVSSNAKAREERPSIVRDTMGVIVAFEMSFVPTKGKAMAHVIGMQRLDTLGRSLWNAGKKSKVVTVFRSDVGKPQLYRDAGSGAFLLFGARDTATGNRDVYGQRFNAAGDQMWGDGERAVAIFHSVDTEANESAIPDGVGGFVVVATSTPTAIDESAPTMIIAQRIDVSGAVVWEDLQPVLPVATVANDCSAPVLVVQ